MRDSLTVLRKELREILGDRHSLYGLLVQGGIVFLLTGIVVPAASGPSWDDVGQITMLYCGFPAAVAAMVAADAFAGERERRTLETLLATPLDPASIFAGKVASAAAFSVAVGWLSVIAAILAAHAKGGLSPLLMPRPEALLWVGGVGLGYSLLTATLAVGISLRLSVARSAQQLAAMLAVGLAVLGSSLLDHGVIRWTTALGVPAILLGLAGLAMLVVLSTLRRERWLGLP